MINLNDFVCITDNEAFQKAISARKEDGIIVVPKRKSNIEPERDYWLLDSAVLLPEDTTIILQNCTIKLSDKCRDNFFRTANCGIGIEHPEKISNIHIIGEGNAVLKGADHPRATGDSSKILANPCPYELNDIIKYADWIPDERRTPETIDFWDMHNHSFGTDAGKPGERQMGDWRGIGILFANTENFSVSNIKIVESHGWGMSFEACAYGRIEKIDFDAKMSKLIDGKVHNMENEDGIDIRNGCHDIVITDITGRTGDDVIALTAIASDEIYPGGSLDYTTQVMNNDFSDRESGIYNITIRNVTAYSDLCLIIRLLAVKTQIRDIIIDGVIDATPKGKTHFGTIMIGESTYGENLKGGIKSVVINNVICNSNCGIWVAEYLEDSVISNIINKNPQAKLLNVCREDGLINVATSNLVTVGS